MTPNRHGTAVVEFPNGLEIVITREFDAPIRLETIGLHETDGVTTLTWRLAFRDQAGRAHWTKTDGLEANFDNVEDLLRSLLDGS